MLMSCAQDFQFWEYKPDVYDYWNFSSLSLLSPPPPLLLSDELPDCHKSSDSSVPRAALLILYCTSCANSLWGEMGGASAESGTFQV